MQRRSYTIASILVAWLLLMFLPQQAQALPSFAKKYGYSCASCHNAWPMLNAFGRRFKENGYQVERDEETSEETNIKADGLSLYKFTPLTVRIKGYAFDKKKDKVTKIRPLHEVELMLAGNIGERASYFVELEGEDEDGWEIFMAAGFVGVHPTDQFNGVLGYGPVFWVDPYQTLADGGRRFTRSHKAFADLGYATGQRIRKSTPQLTGYGRVAKRLFYAAGVNTGTGDPEGADDKKFMGRAAFDVNDNIMIGGYVWAGQTITSEEGPGSDFSRAGIDFQLQYDTFSVFGNWMHASDDLFDDANVPGGPNFDTLTNDVYTVTGLYTWVRNKRPIVVPIVRIESFDVADGSESFTNGTFNLTFYPIANWNVSLEFWANLSTPSGVSKDHRTTLLFNAVF